jgi:hypothetical protein
MEWWESFAFRKAEYDVRQHSATGPDNLLGIKLRNARSAEPEWTFSNRSANDALAVRG